jgi:hypothetical protein
MEFGSPCSMYESYYQTANGKKTLANDMENCGVTSSVRLNTTVNPKASVSRQALLTRACSDWTKNDTTLKFALKKISSEAIPVSSRENLERAYALFYRGKPDPSPSLVDSLQIIANSPSGAASLNSWRSVLFAICASNYWQVL